MDVVYLIYGLFDPRQPTDLEDCRYIGMTSDEPEDRLGGHISSAHQGEQRYVYNWIRSLFEDGVNPVMVVLQDDIIDAEVDGAERAWVAAAICVGARLTNGTEGGRGRRRGLVVSRRFAGTPEERLADKNRRIREGHAKRDKTPTPCPDCEGGPFLGQFGLDRHIQIRHADQEPTMCEECGAGPFRGMHGLHVHARHCGVEEPLYCDECERGPFVGVTGLRSHKLHQHTEDSKEPLMCGCGAGPFMGKHGLNGHISQAHSNKEPIWCECGAGPFNGTTGLATHSRYCGDGADVEPSHCPECGAGPFVGSTGLDSHLYRKHSADQAEMLICPCGAGPFKGTIGLLGHQRQRCQYDQ